MAKELKTGWLVLATSGVVTHGKEDGRFIKKEWLLEMAETFDLSVHTPCIWPDHNRYYNFGKVVALKTEIVASGPLKGEVQLFGILCPNNALINANGEGQYCYPSIEVGENFHGTKKYFLKGLGVTDEPASAGVTELKFKKLNCTLIAGEMFNVNDHLEEAEEESETIPELLKRIFFGKPNTQSPQTPEEDDNEMKPEQFNELKDGIATLATAMTELGKKFSVPGATDPAVPVAPTAEEFKALQDELTALKAKVPATDPAVPVAPTAEEFKSLQDEFAALSTKFAAAVTTEVPGTTVKPVEGDAVAAVY
jgi:hypothetical protein